MAVLTEEEMVDQITQEERIRHETLFFCQGPIEGLLPGKSDTTNIRSISTAQRDVHYLSLSFYVVGIVW